MNHGPEPDRGPEPDHRPDADPPQPAAALLVTIVYGLFVVAAVTWLWLIDRSEVLPKISVGEHGPLVSLGLGTGVGLGLSGLLWLAVRYLRPFRELEERLGTIVGEQSESEIVAISMASAIGEEMLFRGALQVVVGPYFGAVVFGLLHSGPGLLVWGGMATAIGLLFGVMVDSGFGLLSVTVAHALVNFISLRRMTSS